MLLNYLMFWLMCLEAMICLLLSLPFGKTGAQRIVQFLSCHLGGKNSIASNTANIILAVVVILFLSNAHTCASYYMSDAMLSDGMRIRLLTAQRDLYITGFSLFLFLLLRLVYHSIETNIRLDKSLQAMRKQAEGASAGFKSLLEEQEVAKVKMQKLTSLIKSDTSDQEKDSEGKPILERLLDENSTFQTQLQLVEKEREQLKRQVEILQKQANGQNSAFMQLLEEKTLLVTKDTEKKLSVKEETIRKQAKDLTTLEQERDALKSQIQDYDFMFAEARKKAE
ncbi:hypothetical protein ABG067_007019 [Albugo candida]